MITITCEKEKVQEVKELVEKALYEVFSNICPFLLSIIDDDENETECGEEDAKRCFGCWVSLDNADNKITFDLDSGIAYWECFDDYMGYSAEGAVQNALESVIEQYEVSIDGFVGYYDNHCSEYYCFNKENNKIISHKGAYCPVCDKVKPVSEDLEDLVINDYTENCICSKECFLEVTSGNIEADIDEQYGSVKINNSTINSDIWEALKKKYSDS